jgi:hypothetical protein
MTTSPTAPAGTAEALAERLLTDAVATMGDAQHQPGRGSRALPRARRRSAGRPPARRARRYPPPVRPRVAEQQAVAGSCRSTRTPRTRTPAPSSCRSRTGAQELQPDRGRPREPVGELRVRRPAPPAQRPVQQVHRDGRLGARGQPHVALEPLGVDRLRRDVEHVAGRAGDQRTRGRPEQRPQPPDVDLQRVGRPVLPHRRDQLGGWDHPAGCQRQPREQGALPACRNRQGAPSRTTSSGPSTPSRS